MNRIILIVVFTLTTGLLPISSDSAPALDGALCELSVLQADSTQAGKPVVLLRDTVELVRGIRATGFLVSFSIEIEIQDLDTDRVEYSMHVVTLGPSINTYAKQFQSPFGLSGRLEPIIGKAGTSYTLTVNPLNRIAIDTSGCGYLQTRDKEFKFDPSAHADIHFVPNSHGDYLWNNIKFYLEDQYETFAGFSRFGLPGKYQFYLCPCPLRSVIWDKRFHTMVDPTRSAIYSIYTPAFNSADPVSLIQAALYRHHGYAPPFIVEGMAGYLTFASFEAKELAKAKKILPLDSLLGTHYYLKADPRVAENTAASLCKYLIDTYSRDRFMEWYAKADDLNLRTTLRAVFGKTVAEIEKEWLHYLDTVTFTPRRFAQAAMQAETMFQYRQINRFRQKQLELVSERSDSLHILSELGRGSLYVGDYENAVKWQAMRVVLDTLPDAGDILTLGTYRLMLGVYDSAYATLMTAQHLDSANRIIAFNLAHYWLLQGDKQAARKILETLVDGSSSGSADAESRILLANILRESRATLDQKRANEHFTEAIQLLASTNSGNMISAASVMWTGIAYLGLGDTGAAQEYLQTALFLETRPFYQAMDHLWLGKTADLRGERDVAKQQYRAALEVKGAEYHRDEAKALLIKPYK